MGRQPIRIAVLHFSHETVTFLRNDTTIDDFIYPGSPARARRCWRPIRNPTWAASCRWRASSTRSSWSASNRRYGRRPAPVPAG